MTRKITYAGRWNYFKACAGNRRCPWKEGPTPVPMHGQFSARGDRNLSGLSLLLGCTTTTENLVLASSVPSVTRRPHKNPVMGQNRPSSVTFSRTSRGKCPRDESSRIQRCPCHSQYNSQALYSVTKGSHCQHRATCKPLDLGFSHMDASTMLLSHTLQGESTGRSSRHP